MSLISVIVPVYNVDKYLSRCIDSILSQSLNDFDLILIDDGSTDNSGRICDEYKAKDNRIKVIHKENGGLSSARNKGIDYSLANSNSKWLTFIDSDDWVSKYYLEYLYKAALDNNSDISVCDYESVHDSSIKETGFYNVQIINTEEFYSTRRVLCIVSVCKLYKKELFNTIRYPEDKINEDEFVTYKLMFKYNNVVFVNSCLYYYFQRDDSIMHGKWSINRLNQIEAFDIQLSFYKTNNYQNAYKVTVINKLYAILLNIKSIDKNNYLDVLEKLKLSYKNTLCENIQLFTFKEKIYYLSNINKMFVILNYFLSIPDHIRNFITNLKNNQYKD